MHDLTHGVVGHVSLCEFHLGDEARIGLAQYGMAVARITFPSSIVFMTYSWICSLRRRAIVIIPKVDEPANHFLIGQSVQGPASPFIPAAKDR